MNNKLIVVGSMAVIALTAGLSYFNTTKDINSVYQPKEYGKSETRSNPEKVFEYINSLRANPQTGVVDFNEYQKVKGEVMKLAERKNKAALGLMWEQMGPDNVGGRGRAILVDKYNPNTVYAGSISSGLYVSYNQGNTWNHINPLGDNLAVSCITQTDNGRIFFGTGSAFENPNGSSLGSPGFPGNGVYEYVPSTGQVVPVLVANTIPVNSTNGALNVVNAIAARGNRLYIGVKGLHYADPDTNGDYPTTLSGWTNPIVLPGPNVPETSMVHDIDVATDGSMLVSFSNKIYLSPNGSPNSFTIRGVVGASRISAAIAPSDPNVMYVISSNAGQVLNPGTTSDPRGLEVSLDKGVTWHTVIPGGIPSIDVFRQYDGTGGQGGWDQAIAVDPSNPDRVLVGGVQFYEFNLNRTSSPLGGNWVKAAVLNSFATPYYIHADNHSMHWYDANTVFVIGDGGVFRSTDGGQTWLHMTLGFNANTFFSVAAASNGWFMGGSQDNGTQLFEFGQLGVTSPKGTIEIQGGDGFATEFSDFGGGIAFACSQYGNITRQSAQSPGQGGTFFDTELTNWTSYPFNTKFRLWESVNDPLSIDSINVVFQDTTTLTAGQTFVYQSLTNSEDLYYTPTTTTTYFPGDTLRLQDYYQSRFAFYIGSGLVYLTKDATRLNASSNDWHRVASNVGGVIAMEFSPDGNHLYLGNTSGEVYRISGLALGNNDSLLDVRETSHITTKTLIASSLGGPVTGIAIDPNNGENLIATVGGYGVNNHVYRTTMAESVTGTGSFDAIQGPFSPSAQGYLPKMPVYDAEIDMSDENIVIIGTDFGVWATSNAFSATLGSQVEWYNESVNGMAHVPVFEVKQQHRRKGTAFGYSPFSMMLYLGTHGGGFYTSSSLVDPNVVGVNEQQNVVTNEFKATLDLYPNPISYNGTIDIALSSSTRSVIKVFNLNGAIVKTIDLGTLPKGKHLINFDASDLSVGTYIMALDGDKVQKVTKFIVNR